MKTNIYTDRFETTLPSEVRKRFGERPPAKYVATPPPRNRTTSISPWLIAGGITVFIGLAATAHILAGFADKADTLRYTHETVSTPPPAPIPVMAPVATPAPAPIPEVRRAELVPSEASTVYGTVLAHMPDGEIIRARPLGSVTRQEDLPLTGNRAGDAYIVAGIPFVWTQLNNGAGAWIDPQIE